MHHRQTPRAVRLLALSLLTTFLGGPALAEPALTDVRVDPPTVQLTGPAARYLLLVQGKRADGRLVDLTRDARFHVRDPKVVRVTDTGIVEAVGDGATEVRVIAAGRTLSVAVNVSESGRLRKFNFENDLIPLFSRFGCNASGCHGKAEGQNGFKLSVFGFDPPADYNALVKEARGRRVFPAAPDESLLLRKMSGRTAHGGGVRIPSGSRDYETIRAWIAAGMPFGESTDPTVTAIRVDPRERILDVHGRQQLRVLARWSDGHEADVTAHARFQTNNDALAAVSADGLVSAGEAPGQVAVMASFMNHVDVFRALIPRPGRVDDFPRLAENNFVDRHVLARLRKLNLLPSELCDDAEFLRRVSLDVIGTLPTAAEARRFLADRRPDRRLRLVDELLARPEYADFWALKWADLLRVDRQVLGHKRAYAYYKWVRDSLARNRPYDRFVRDILTAEGPLADVPAGNFYKVVTESGKAASDVAQVFLGVRIACAQCHHHPFDRWSQTDYQGMLAFFAQVGARPSPRGEAVFAEGEPEARHPRTGEVVHAHPLGSPAPQKSPAGDRRLVLANWVTNSANPFFARNLVNRYWAHFMGRGLVEPVDDVRATNPPSNPELLDALAKSFVDSKYDVKQLIRTITASRVYQLSSQPNATNEGDEQNYSRARLKRVGAEVLLDMVCQATGIGEKFDGVPPGYRAIQLWDSKVGHYFLKTFGRPERVSACECERTAEPSVAQVLHLLNAPEMHVKISHAGGRVAKLVRQVHDDGALAEQLYLTFYGRFPEEKERAVAVEYLKKGKANRQQAAEDLAWSLMNSLEFVFNH
ncbi:MAG: DUF1553 domain-containing protein [Planctomycetes bacterium]|nr:DUF1553 domain-containing protein [Planctomycetota bacterium]